MTCLIWLLHQKSLSRHLNVVADFGESQPTRMEISIELANKNGDVIQQWRIDWGPTAEFHWKYRTVWVVGILNTFRISRINRNCNIRQQNLGLDQRKWDCLPIGYSSSPTITVGFVPNRSNFSTEKEHPNLCPLTSPSSLRWFSGTRHHWIPVSTHHQLLDSEFTPSLVGEMTYHSFWPTVQPHFLGQQEL